MTSLSFDNLPPFSIISFIIIIHLIVSNEYTIGVLLQLISYKNSNIDKTICQ